MPGKTLAMILKVECKLKEGNGNLRSWRSMELILHNKEEPN
jgi:hypothetical protein